MDKSFIVMGRQATGKRVLARQMRREMTMGETLLWQCLRRNALDGLHFRRQQVIDGFIADFYCHAAGLVIEVDGGVHLAQEEYDALRDQLISVRGLKVLRFTNEQVETDLTGVLQTISKVAHQRLDTAEQA